MKVTTGGVSAALYNPANAFLTWNIANTADTGMYVADGEIVEITSNIKEGEEVKVIEGPFLGVRALVTRILPAHDRVAILLSLLGQEREVEISAKSLLPDTRHPLAG